MQDKINNLISKVGTKYEMFFEDGNYCGCFFPVYEVFTDLPHFPLPSEDPEKNLVYGLDLIKKYTDQITEDELQAGDIIACEFREELHVALYIGEGKIIHVFKGHDLRINKLDFIRKGLHGFFRVKQLWR
jgi:hypothetical protein